MRAANQFLVVRVVDREGGFMRHSRIVLVKGGIMLRTGLLVASVLACGSARADIPTIVNNAVSSALTQPGFVGMSVIVVDHGGAVWYFPFGEAVEGRRTPAPPETVLANRFGS